MSAVLSMPPGYYDALKRLTAEVTGIRLEDNYQFIIETRLASIARKEGYASLIEMVQSMFKSGDSRLAIKMVAALLERDTHFFRDKASLIGLSDFILPRLYEVYKARPIKVLIIGSNSGQEAYSAAILADKLKQTQLPDLTVEFTVVDYPSEAIEKAKSGRYTHFDVQRGLPVRDMIAYFTRVGEDWIVSDALRKNINFTEAHLLRLPDDIGTYHAIICRDMFSQFQYKVRAKFIRKITKHIKTRGYLLIGTDEHLPDTTLPWIESGGPETIYQRAKTQAELIADERAARAARKLLSPDPERFFEEAKAKKAHVLTDATDSILDDMLKTSQSG